MKAELRVQLGKAAYEAAIKRQGPSIGWEELSQRTKGFYGDIAEAVVQELGGIMVAQLQYVAMVLTDRPIEMHLREKTAVWPDGYREETNI